MLGKEFVFRGVIARYLDEGPLEFRRNFTIYTKTADAVIFNQYQALAPSPEGVERQSIRKSFTYMPTRGKESRVREIENGLKRECGLNASNLIELSSLNVHAEFDVITMHLEKIYGKDARKSYVFVDRARPFP